MIHKNNEHPEGKYIPPDRRIFATVAPCTTRQMTEEEREKYGEPNPVKRRCDAYTEKEVIYIITEKDKAYAAKVKAEREKRELSQKMLAKLCGVSATTIRETESVHRIPKAETKRKINKYFGWEDDDLER